MVAAGRYAKGAERREEILRAAFDVLGREGYSRTSLAEIGRSLGVTSAHVLYYFPTREALLQEVLERWDVVRSDVRGDADRPFSWWVESLRHNEGDRGILQLYIAFAMEAADTEHPAHDYYARRFVRIERDVAAEIAALQAAGRLRAAVDPRNAANLLISVSDGLTVRWLIDPSVDMAAGFALAVEQLLES